MAERRRGFMSGLVPPSFVAMVISLENLLKTAPRLESTTALRRLILDHLLWPAMNRRVGGVSDQVQKDAARQRRLVKNVGRDGRAAALRCERGRTHLSLVPCGKRNFGRFGTASLEQPDSSPSVHQIERIWNTMNVRGETGRCN